MLLVWSNVCKRTSNSKYQVNRGGTAQITASLTIFSVHPTWPQPNSWHFHISRALNGCLALVAGHQCVWLDRTGPGFHLGSNSGDQQQDGGWRNGHPSTGTLQRAWWNRRDDCAQAQRGSPFFLPTFQGAAHLQHPGTRLPDRPQH